MAGLLSSQIDMYIKLVNMTGGIKKGDTVIYSGGHQAGKSMYYTYANNNLCKEIMLPTKAKSKYKFSRAKWHTVDIGMGGWRLSREYNEIIEWCTEQFGEHPREHDAWSRWWVGVGTMYFRDEKDYVLFQLKWA